MGKKLRVLKKIRKETVVHIPKGTIQADGSTSIQEDLAEEILVRWEDDSIEYVTKEGETEQSRAVAYVGKDLEINAYLFRGTLVEFNALTDEPKTKHGKMFEIKGRKILPTLGYGDFLRMVFLGPFN